MPISREDLQKQLAHTQQEFENAKASAYRADGVIQMLQHLIAETETDVTPADPPTVTPDSPKE